MAIKRIGDVFRVETDTRRFLREIHILRHLNHPNIIRVLDAFYPGGEDTFSELYIVFEVRDTPMRCLRSCPCARMCSVHVLWAGDHACGAGHFLLLSGHLTPLTSVGVSILRVVVIDAYVHCSAWIQTCLRCCCQLRFWRTSRSEPFCTRHVLRATTIPPPCTLCRWRKYIAMHPWPNLCHIFLSHAPSLSLIVLLVPACQSVF